MSTDSSPPTAPPRTAWNLKLGRFLGIDVYLHATFLLLLAFIGISQWVATHDWSQVFQGVAFIALLFLCVVLHEYGHALTARRYGIATRDITLYPIGGVARLEKMPKNPWHELWVALAGPAVNIVLAAGLWAWLSLSDGWVPWAQMGTGEGPLPSGQLVQRLLFTNLFLAAFNLLPAFPMDGGRVLRALLAMAMDHAQATAIAARIGQLLAVLFGLAGLLLGHPMLVLIAVFVWFGAAGESAMAQTESQLAGVMVSRAMLRDFRSLDPRDPVGVAVRMVLDGSQHDFPVTEQEQPVGILTRTHLLEVLSQGGQDLSVGAVMNRDFLTTGPDQMLVDVLPKMNAARQALVPVVVNERLVGLLTTENVNEFLMIRAALRQAARG